MIFELPPHRVKHGNVMESIDDLMRNDRAEIFYSDPPWGQGNLSYWATMNTKMTGAPRALVPVLSAFLDRIFEIADKYCDDMIFIEYGVRWADEITSRADKLGIPYCGKIGLRYAGAQNLPLDLHVMSKRGFKLFPSYVDAVTDTQGMRTLRAAVLPFAKAGKIILDPCCGMGYTAQIAIESRMHFRGNELNAKRLSKTIERLSRDYLP